MTEQMTPQAVTLLVGALIVFWTAVATLVRLHRRRRNGPTQRATEARG